jgi:hypothetical protein
MDMIAAWTEVAAEFRQGTPFVWMLTERKRLKGLAAFDTAHPRVMSA